MDSGPPARNPWKPLIDFGPLLAFFLVNAKWGLLPATGALVPLSVAAMLASWRLEGRVSRFALYGTVAIVVFGTLTLVIGDETFIKIKVTVINAILGSILGIGLLRRKPLLKDLMGKDLKMSEAGWTLLTLRFTLFFFALAALNEVLRRVLTSDQWVTFKTFGIIGVTLVFTLLQTSLIKEHALEESEGPERTG